VKYPLNVVKACLTFHTREDKWQHSRSGRFNLRRSNVVTHVWGQKRINLDLEFPWILQTAYVKCSPNKRKTASSCHLLNSHYTNWAVLGLNLF
jgi:hypothetical protein